MAKADPGPSATAQTVALAPRAPRVTRPASRVPPKEPAPGAAPRSRPEPTRDRPVRKGLGRAALAWHSLLKTGAGLYGSIGQGSSRGAGLAALLGLGMFLAGCDLSRSLGPAGSAAPVGPASEPAARPLSDDSIAARAYYGRIETAARARGQLRTDGGGTDTPFSADDLARNFERIAFFDEFQPVGGQLVARSTESTLHRWQGAVRVDVVFGDSVPLDQRARDRAEIAAYLARLSDLTGLPIRMTGFAPNFSVMILNEDERRGAGPGILDFAPAIAPEALASAVGMKPDTYCTVFSFSAAGSATYARALAVIRGELPDILRLSCIHEEIAQGLGLVNDSPRARPSIFNDNDEFATLTRQDELMLRMLYDRRLSPGMGLSQAAPTVVAIAAELMGGEIIAALP